MRIPKNLKKYQFTLNFFGFVPSAAMSLGIYTREQIREINALYFGSDGLSDMIRNAADEMLKQQSVE